MKSKILIQVYVPAFGKYIEMRIPRQLKVGQVLDIIAEYFSGSFNECIRGENLILCDADSGRSYSVNVFIEQLGLTNGSRIMVV